MSWLTIRIEPGVLERAWSDDGETITDDRIELLKTPEGWTWRRGARTGLEPTQNLAWHAADESSSRTGPKPRAGEAATELLRVRLTRIELHRLQTLAHPRTVSEYVREKVGL